jgi:hypothetical protein
MKKNIIFIIFVCAIVFFIAISSHGASRESKTIATIFLVNKLFEKCRNRDGPSFDKVKCIYDYGKENELPEQRRASWAVDGYGNPLVFEKTAICRSESPCALYSKGANGVDECGRGDDVSLRRIANRLGGCVRL